MHADMNNAYWPSFLTSEREQAMVRFSRVSKKKETEKTRFEAQADLYAATKKYHTVSGQEPKCDFHPMHD